MKEYVGITLNVINYNDELKNNILKRLNESIAASYGKEAKIIFLSSSQYWKYPEEMQCFFVLFADYFVSVRNTMELFTQQYSYDITTHDAQREPYYERAFWAPHVQGGIFLDLHVVWAHFYTCEA